MKHIILVILLFAMSVFLLSCAVTQENTESMNSCATPWHSFRDYDKYHEYVRQQILNGKLPSNFVPASAFFILGEFDSFVHTDYAPMYFHEIIDSNNIKLEIWITHSPREVKRQLINLPDNTSDLRVLYGIDGNAKYVRHGLTYMYRPMANLDEGVVGLDSVRWVEAGIEYSLKPNGTFSKYPMDGEETILSRLLSIDENVSKAAFEELKAYMRTHGAPNPYGGYCVLIAAAALIALFSYRRIKGKSATPVTSVTDSQ